MVTDSTTHAEGLSGPHSWYRPKDTRHPITVNLTRPGRAALKAIQKRTDASRGDIVEQLVRRFGDLVVFPEPAEKEVKRLTKAQKAYVREIIGEAFHTAFRKASDHETADRIWRAIKEMPVESWSAVLDFVEECL